MPEAFDCCACGACCRDAADGRVPVASSDISRWRREGRLDILERLVEGHFSTRAYAADSEGACVHLHVLSNERVSCSIYATRGSACRALEPGSAQCLAYRRVDR